MKSKFKVGQMVRLFKGTRLDDDPCWVSDMDKYIGKILKVSAVDSENSISLEGINQWRFADRWLKPIKKSMKINYILKYELDEDPIEEFETLKQVRERVEELAKDDSLKRDSIVVYEVKSVKKVSIETKTIITGI